MGSVTVDYSLLQPFYICPINGEIDGKISKIYIYIYILPSKVLFLYSIHLKKLHEHLKQI